ncbi:MAG: YfiR family protein [Ignavibacteriae bacterium]|nr:YfiR family protein [Ignavibacteriota bacterium]
MLAAIVLCLSWSATTISFAQSPQEVEERLKAVYVFNFLQFIEWPASSFENSDSPIIIGVLGPESFKNTLDEIVRSERIGNRLIQTKRYASVSDIDKCHLLYISPSEDGKMESVLRQVEQSATLTVSDIDQFAEMGGDIGFFLENNKVRFAINVQSLRTANLNASSKLLRLAKIIGQ